MRIGVRGRMASMSLISFKVSVAQRLGAVRLSAQSLGCGALCFVSPARFAGSSFTYAKRPTAQTLGLVISH